MTILPKTKKGAAPSSSSSTASSASTSSSSGERVNVPAVSTSASSTSTGSSVDVPAPSPPHSGQVKRPLPSDDLDPMMSHEGTQATVAVPPAGNTNKRIRRERPSQIEGPVTSSTLSHPLERAPLSMSEKRSHLNHIKKAVASATAAAPAARPSPPATVSVAPDVPLISVPSLSCPIIPLESLVINNDDGHGIISGSAKGCSVSIDTNATAVDPDHSDHLHDDPMSPSPPSPTGYNSGDEYGTGPPSNNNNTTRYTPEQMSERERRFDKKLWKKGYTICKMGEDGACLFRAVADQMYGDEKMHTLVRQLCCDYMTKNKDYFAQYVTEDFPQYVSRKRREHIQGNHVEIQALSEMFARPIEVYHYSSEPINIFQHSHDEEMICREEPIRLSYHSSNVRDSGHYNSVRDRLRQVKPKGTLITYTPPKMMDAAIRSSETDALEKAMLEDKIRATDWEATNEALEEQVARESYLEWLKEDEKRRRRPGSTGRSSPLSSSSSVSASVMGSIEESKNSSGGESPKAGGSRSSLDRRSPPLSWKTMFPHPSTHSQPNRTSSVRFTLPSESSPKDSPASPKKCPSPSFYYQELPDGPESEQELLARVMMASRQEYIESLHKKRRTSPNRSPKHTMSTNNSNSPRHNREKTPPPSSSRS